MDMRLSMWLVALLGSTTVLAAAEEGPLPAGSPAPAFELRGSDGAVHRLSDHLGKRAVVVAWFPKAFTGG